MTTALKPAKAFEEALPKGKSAAVIGVGQVALEVAGIPKAKGYERIHLIGRSDRVLRAHLDAEMSRLVEERTRAENIELALQTRITGVKTHGTQKRLSSADGDLDVDLLFLGTGTGPNSDLAQKAGIKLGETGAIAVNEYLQTSDPDIYAIGDCMENWDRITGGKRCYQTATNAARTGRLAGRNAVLGNKVSHQGTVGSFITDVFGLQVGTIGLTEDQSRELGLDAVASVTATATRRRPFGGKSIHIKLIANRQTHTLLGAQVLGEELVAGKIDRLAVAMAEGIPAERLSMIETCYAPTVGAGYEAVTMALDELIEKLGAP